MARSIASYAAAGARTKARRRGGVNHCASGVQGSGRQDPQQFAECAILATPRKHGAHEAHALRVQEQDGRGAGHGADGAKGLTD